MGWAPPPSLRAQYNTLISFYSSTLFVEVAVALIIHLYHNAFKNEVNGNAIVLYFRVSPFSLLCITECSSQLVLPSVILPLESQPPGFKGSAC